MDTMTFTTRSNLSGSKSGHKTLAAAVKAATKLGHDWVERSIPGIFQAEDFAALTSISGVSIVRVQINGCVIDRAYVRKVYIPRSIIVKA